MEFPLVTKQLALRVGRSEADHFVSWLGRMKTYEDGAFGIEIRQFGQAVALVNAEMTLGPLFNRVLGFGDADADFLEEIVQFYEERDIACRIDINPYDASFALFKKLAAFEFRPFRFHAHLYGLPESALASEPAPGIQARGIWGDELSSWAQIWREGYAESLGVPEAMAGKIADATQQLHGQPGWGLYLAFAGEQPAAAGALYVQDGTASLLVGATLPAFRRRGCQRALLQARMADAARQGCDLAAAQAGLDTTSQHNMERAGMRIAYTRAFWLRPKAIALS